MWSILGVWTGGDEMIEMDLFDIDCEFDKYDLGDFLNRVIVNFGERIKALEYKTGLDATPLKPDDSVKGSWVCGNCGRDWGREGYGLVSSDYVMRVDARTYNCTGINGGCGKAAVKWIEPTPKEKAEPKAAEPEGMERFIGMFVTNGPLVGILQEVYKSMARPYRILFNDTSYRVASCKPHPISEELIRLREHVEKHYTGAATAYIKELESDNAELKAQVGRWGAMQAEAKK